MILARILSKVAVAGACSAAISWAGAGAARADEPGAGGASAPAPAAEALVIVVEVAPAGVDPARVRAAVARELGVAVTLAPASDRRGALVLRAGGERRAVLIYRAEDGRVLERAVELPASSDQAVEVLALLAGNLVRNEAAELSEALRAARASGAGSGAAAPSAAPASGASPASGAATAPGASPASSAAPASDASTAPARRPNRAAAAPQGEQRSAPAASQPRCAQAGASSVPIGVDVFPYVGTSSIVGVNVVRRFSLNLAASYVTGLEGVEIAGGANVESGFACGVQIAGAANVVTGPVVGWQAAAGGNVSGPLEGVQTAGAMNLAGEMQGLQLGSINIATGRAEGAQLGAVDVAAGGVKGAQLGAVNVVAGGVVGAQLGAVNVATGDVVGVQIGAINVARRSTFSLGALTIVPEGRLHLDVWGTESGLVMAGIKHGGDHFHNIYGAGFRPGGEGLLEGAAVLGFGGHFPLSSRVFVDTDLLVHSLFGSEETTGYAMLTQLRAIVGVKLARGFAVFGGPSASWLVSSDPDTESLSVLGGPRYHAGEEGFALRSWWPGLTLGVQAL